MSGRVSELLRAVTAHLERLTDGWARKSNQNLGAAANHSLSAASNISHAAAAGAAKINRSGTSETQGNSPQQPASANVPPMPSRPPAGPPPKLTPLEVENSLTNLAGSSKDRLRNFGPGSGFSGVYHPESGHLLAYPSGDTRRLDSPETPANHVSRYGGHADVEDVLLEAIDRQGRYGECVGFSAVLRDDGSFGCRWTSRSVNLENRSFEGPYVPEHMRPEIMRVLREVTSREVESDV